MEVRAASLMSLYIRVYITQLPNNPPHPALGSIDDQASVRYVLTYLARQNHNMYDYLCEDQIISHYRLPVEKANN